MDERHPLAWVVDADAFDVIVGNAPVLALSFCFSGYRVQIDGSDVGVSPAATGTI